MKIDWFTVIAQIFNFMILVMLLKRYLYKPVLKAIHDRETLISSQLAEAGIIKTESDRIRDKYYAEKEALDKNLSGYLEKAERESEEQRQKWLEDAKREVESLKATLYKNLREEQKNLQEEISDTIQREVLSVTRKVISDLAGEQLENLIVQTFHKKLAGLDEDERSKFIKVMGLPGSQVMVATSFPLSQELTEETIRVLKLISPSAEIKFTISSGQIIGITLECNGYQIAWNIHDYLDGIEKRIADLTAEDQQQEIITSE